MAGKWANSRRAQVYRYLAANVGKVVHVDKLARHLGLSVDHDGLQKARRPIYDLINNGDVELEQLVAGGCWRVKAVIGDDEAPEGARETVERDEADAAEALGPAKVAVPPTVTYEFVGSSQDGGTPIVRDSTGRVYRLVRI
jgi:hypothetical protein